MNCYHCETELIWGGENTFEDMDLDGEGIITNLSCPKCEAQVEVYKQYTEEDEDNILYCDNCAKEKHQYQLHDRDDEQICDSCCEYDERYANESI